MSPWFRIFQISKDINMALLDQNFWLFYCLFAELHLEGLQQIKLQKIFKKIMEANNDTCKIVIKKITPPANKKKKKAFLWYTRNTVFNQKCPFHTGSESRGGAEPDMRTQDRRTFSFQYRI